MYGTQIHGWRGRPTRIVSIRKNLNISIENEKRIQKLRSIVLQFDIPIDLDYTGATNMLIELGDFLLRSWYGHAQSQLPVSGENVSEVITRYLKEAMSIEPGKEELIRQFMKSESVRQDPAKKTTSFRVVKQEEKAPGKG